MTREEVTAQILSALSSAPKTAPRALLQALRDAGQFIEDQTTQPAAEGLATSPSQEGVASATAAPPGFVTLARQCANELFEAIELKVGVMDSDSKAHAINLQRVDIMQSVAARLREVA